LAVRLKAGLELANAFSVLHNTLSNPLAELANAFSVTPFSRPSRALESRAVVLEFPGFSNTQKEGHLTWLNHSHVFGLTSSSQPKIGFPF